MKEESAPANLHVKHPNPAINFNRWRLKVTAQVEPNLPFPNDGQQAH
jgi:acyl transferase domain-containing protein